MKQIIKKSEVGQRIIAARKNLGLTQTQLAEALNVNQQTITFWEREANAPRAEVLPKMAEVLNVSIDYLLTGATPKKKKPGPDNKIDKTINELSELPKNERNKILDVVDAFVKQSKAN